MALAFHVDEGSVDGLDVSGLTVCVVADAPAMMAEGGWKLGLLMDDQASPEQAEALAGVFGGGNGGPMAGLAPLVGEMVGSQAVPMKYVNDGRTHSLTAGSAVTMTVEDFVSPLDPTESGVKISGVGFPADTLAVGFSTENKVDAFGFSWSTTGKNSFSAPFAWSA